MNDPIVFLLILILALIIITLIVVIMSKNKQDLGALIEAATKDEFKTNRLELQQNLKDTREELSNTINAFQGSFNDSFKMISDNQLKALGKLTERVEAQLFKIDQNQKLSSKESRDELNKELKEFNESFSKNVKDFNELQRLKFGDMAKRQEDLVKMTENRLEKMRQTVDEKLHKTLEERLGQSFKIVSEQLQAVQKGLGEMQSLASGVGDLKKVLSNVKTRGVLGEMQLGNILEQIMSPNQYEANVKTKQGSNDHVEFAIKLPGKDDGGSAVYLPIDAKFPLEDYYRLQTAYDEGDLEGIDKATKSLVQSIKKFAKDIRDKYIDPPGTTDFGIMFLPIEGLYAEIVRRTDVIEHLQREYKIIITGPTTLAAMLNSLQMGFKTLAIQKRSSEVWRILSAVKTEFGKFGGVLEKAQKKINEANIELDRLVTTRTNVIKRKLRDVQELPESGEEQKLSEAEETSGLIIDKDEEFDELRLLE